MENKIKLLRISYWAAAIADFLVAVSVLIPERMGLTEYVYPMGLMSSVAFSWGVLLLCADRKPLERRWIIPPTILVVALLGITGLHAGLFGLIEVYRIVLSSIAVVVVLILLIVSWITTRNLS